MILQISIQFAKLLLKYLSPDSQMPKKIRCSCQQGYHYSQASRAHCLNINGLFKSNKKLQEVHLNGCICQLCKNQIGLPIVFLQPRQQLKQQAVQQQLPNNSKPYQAQQDLIKQLIFFEPNPIQIQPKQNPITFPQENKQIILQQRNTTSNKIDEQLLQRQILPLKISFPEQFFKKQRTDHRNKRQKQIRKLRLRRKTEKRKKQGFYSCGYQAHQHKQLKYAKRCRSRRYIGYNVQAASQYTVTKVFARIVQVASVPIYDQVQNDVNVKRYFQYLEQMKKQNKKFLQTKQRINDFQKSLLGKKQWVNFTVFSTNNNLFSSFQLRQTMFGDCFLMSVCMALANLDTKLIQQFFIIKQQNQPGYYVIKLFFQGKVLYQQIDPFVFVRVQGNNKMSYIGYAQGALWFTLLGKALIQLVGAPKYNNILSSQVIEYLFGRLPTVIIISKISDIIKLFNAKKKQIMIITSKKIVKNPWIPQTHAFPILQTDKSRISISNTWGYFRNVKSTEKKQNQMWLQQKDLEDFDLIFQLDL